MKRLAVLVVSLALTGCGDYFRSEGGAIMDPATSKAIAEQDQLREMKAQTELVKRQTLALEAIAARCGR